MLAGYSWEQDESCAVRLQALDVRGEGFGGEVCAAGVDGDADCRGEFAGDAGFL